MSITKEFKDTIANLACKYHLSCVILFGSQATGKTHAQSDTDMAFLSDHEINFDERIAMKSDFADALRIKNLELINARKVYPIFMKQIADKGKVLYEDSPGIFTTYKVYAFKMYVDTAPLRKMREEYLNRFIASHA